MAKSDGSTLIAWGAGLVGAYFFLPSILKTLTARQTNGQFLEGTATRQAAQGISTVGTIGNAALASYLAKLLGQQQQKSGGGGGGASVPKSLGETGLKPSPSSKPYSLVNTLNSWFGDKTESTQIAMLLTGGRTIDQAAAAVEENPRDIISALTGVNVTGDVATEYSPTFGLIDTSSTDQGVLSSLIGYADSTRVDESGYGIIPTFGTIDEPQIDNFDASGFGLPSAPSDSSSDYGGGGFDDGGFLNPGGWGQGGDISYDEGY